MKKSEIVEKLDKVQTTLAELKNECLDCPDINGYEMENIDNTFESMTNEIQMLKDQFSTQYDENGEPICGE